MNAVRLTLVLAISLLPAAAQSKTPALPAIEATGVITGRVFCSDTNQPARFAKVSLEPVRAEAASTTKSAHRQPTNTYTGNGVTSVDTTLDGTFTLTQVKPGSYYVIVSKGGYVSPRAMFTQKELDAPTPEQHAAIERVLPRVDIENGQSAHVEVRLEHGASISGTVLYDDGSPAGEISMNLLHKDAAGKWVQLQGAESRGAGWTNTDDRGRYRFSSLLPDEYMVKAELSLGNSRESSMGSGDMQMLFNMMTIRSSLPFYGDGTPHQAEAKPIKLSYGDERSGQDVTLPISKLFRITGHVSIAGSGHLVNAADLKLVDKDDGQEITGSDIEREDGLFHFDFVPAGSYTLRVSNARDVVWEPEQPAVGAQPSPFPAKDKERVLKSYGGSEQPLNVQGDVLGMTATVQPDAPK